MPGRQSHGMQGSKRNKPRSYKKWRSLNALSIASQLAAKKTNTIESERGIQELSFKAKKRPFNIKAAIYHDFHESIPKKPKSEQVQENFDDLELDKGSDSEGNEWKLGQVDTDNDSELDSDEAFGESDEERFDGLAFSGSTKTQQKKLQEQNEIDICEKKKIAPSSKLEESDLGEDATDLARMLDISDTEDEITRDDLSNETNSVLATDSESDESNEDDSSSKAFSSSDETSDPTKMLALQKLISNLSRVDEHQGQADERNNHPNESNIISDCGIIPKRKLTLEDLGLPSVVDPHIKKSLKILSSTDKKSTAKLAVPLEKRQQDRLDRSAAYEKSKETLDRWVETVKHNRRADHISFPLIDHGMVSSKSNKVLLPLKHSEPYNELESTIKNILDESGLATVEGKDCEDRIREIENLETNHMSLDQIRARRDKLRLARELMFREEARSKRIKKIKSKSYRRVHRKERENLARLQEQALEGDGVMPSFDELDLRDRKRAQERMGARHRDSKWAKSVRTSKRAAWDEDARSGIAEMARRDEELRKRVDGKISRKEYEGPDTSSESDDESCESNEQSIQEQTLRKLEAESQSDFIDESIPGAKLANMNFMLRADAARKKQNDFLVNQIKRELNGEISDEASGSEEPEIGRRIFGKYVGTDSKEQRPTHANEHEEIVTFSDGEIASSKLDNMNPCRNPINLRQKGPNIKPKYEKTSVNVADTALNLEGGAWSKPQVRSTGTIDTEAYHRRKKKKALVDQEELDLSKAEKVTNKHQIDTTYSKDLISDDSDDNSTKSFSLNRDQELIKRAFAGADVVGEFEAEKKQVIKEQDDKTIDHTLPGWGSWVGNGVNKKYLKSNKNRFVSTIKGVKASDRKDINLQRVIINEKKIKKVFALDLYFELLEAKYLQNSKYLASSLPHPFETRRQYERSLRLPIGPEWTTKQTFQSATKPRIILKKGIIAPISQPLL